MFNLKLFASVILGTLVVMALAAWGLFRISVSGEVAGVSEDLVSDTPWVVGSKNSKVTVVEFSCLQCPACRSTHWVSTKLKQMEGVTYVWRFSPLTNIHKNAYGAAKVAQAAQELGKGWEMIDLLFEKQADWSDENDFEALAVSYAKSLDLDEQDFKQIYNSSEVEEQIKTDMVLVNKLRLNGTPTFFVNGKLTAANFVISEVEKLLQ